MSAKRPPLSAAAGLRELTGSTTEPGSRLAGARELPLARISPNPRQPRKHFAALDTLAADIADRGVLQPIVVRVHPTDPERYMIVAGERRWRAAQLAGLEAIPAIIRTYDTDAQAQADTAVENLQRADLTLGEEADLYKDLMTVWQIPTATGLAERLHRPVRRIQRVLQLVTAAPDLAGQVDAGQLSFEQALATIRQPGPTHPPPPPPQYDDTVTQRQSDVVGRGDSNTASLSPASSDGDLAQRQSDAARRGGSNQEEPAPPSAAARLASEVQTVRRILDHWRMTHNQLAPADHALLVQYVNGLVADVGALADHLEG